VSWSIPDEVVSVLRSAEKHRLAPTGDGLPVLDRAGIEALVPHRGDALLLDRVTALDAVRGTVVARYDLDRAAAALAGHFPGHAVWPGTAQVEAIGQAGLVFVRATASPGPAVTEVSLARILGARLMRAVRPPADVEIVARVMEDGLFTIVVGQCLVDGSVCSVAALSGVA
jgi:3-hydroxyacyl-[acyl-carrier-protein] dehydratase